MPYVNAQNPNCPNCNKIGLAILPVRYAVIPADVCASLPEPLGDKVTNVKIAHARYALRTLRQGFLYLFHEKHPRGSQIKWEVYAVSESGTMWKSVASSAIEAISNEPVCSRNGHNIPASIITIESPEKCAKVWIAFSEHAWSSETLNLYERDVAQREKRMQSLRPSAWLNAGGDRHGLECSEENLRKVIEYAESSICSRLEGGKIEYISKPDGTYDSATLKRQSSRFPQNSRRGQRKDLLEAMTVASTNANGTTHPPVLLALWDSVGIAHELNGYRNDAAGWIARYGTERELEITASNAIAGVKKALEDHEAHKAQVAANDNSLHWTKASSALRIQNFTNARPSDAAGRARQADLCLRWEQDSAHKAPSMIAMRRESAVNLPEEEWQRHMARIDGEITQWKSKTVKDGRTIVKVQNDRSHRWEEAAIAEAWPRYQKKIDQVALDSFNEKYRRFLSDAAKLVDDRTADLLAWLESSQLVNALTEYNKENITDGVAFEDAVGAMVFGISSSEKGAAKIDVWVKEAKATDQNLLWRAIAANQSEAMVAVDAILAAGISHSDTPLSESALNAARDSTKHLAKFADLAKKSLSLHNSLRKEGVTRIGTGGIEKILMTVGDRFFQPFMKKGVDLLSEKLIQSLLLARAGASYVTIMDLMLAEARFGASGRAETLVALSMGHVIATKTVSNSQKSLQSAWSALASNADVPKQHLQPQRSGAFNEAKELRFAMTATLLQGLFVLKLADDAEKDPNNTRLRGELFAAELSLGAGFIDLGATAIKGLNAAKDAAISFQILKLSGGILSGATSCIATSNDISDLLKQRRSGHYLVATLYGFKATFDFASGSCSALVAISYARPVFERLASSMPNTLMGRVGSIVPRFASPVMGRLLLGRALLMAGGLWFGVGVLAIQLLIWKFSDNELQSWCAHCAFGTDKSKRTTSAKLQMSALEDALKETMQ